MADEEKKEGGEHINLKVVTQDGNEIYFKCKQTTPLQKLMHAFCNRQGVTMGSVRFLFDGNRINETQTPSQVRARRGQRTRWVRGGGVGAPAQRLCAARTARPRRGGHEPPQACDAVMARQLSDRPSRGGPRRSKPTPHPPVASQLEMEDGDVIDVMVEQQGGFLF